MMISKATGRRIPSVFGDPRRVWPLLMLALGVVALAQHESYAEDGRCRDGAQHWDACGDLNAEDVGAPRTNLVKIDLTRCDDGAVARWHRGSVGIVTFKINDWVGVTDEVVSAVRQGVLQWNRAQPFYAVSEVTTGDADIVIEVFDQVLPGIVGATKVKCENGRDGIRQAAIYLGVKAISPLGVRNMTAHEMGHALGLGHSDKSWDLMDSDLAKKGVESRAICPSNLDRGGLIAGFHSYAMPQEDWAEIECPAQTRG